MLNGTTIVPAVQRVLGQTTPDLVVPGLPPRGDAVRAPPAAADLDGARPEVHLRAHPAAARPVLFRADGSPLPEAEAKATDEKILYANHLAFASSQIKDIVGYLLSGPEETRPIVIIEGDEGPAHCQSVDCVTNTPDYLRSGSAT